MAVRPQPSALPALPRKGKKYFTLAEANRALPYVARIIEDVVRVYRSACDLRGRFEQGEGKDDLEKIRDQYEEAMRQLNSLVEELQAVGAELKDFETGLLDFPAQEQGREICLCWRRGEGQILAWHEVDAGFAGRQNVELLH